MILADTPHLKKEPPICLASRGTPISACVTRRAATGKRIHDEAERETALAEGATFVDLRDQVCPYDPCPVIIDDVLLWRDRSHITATFAKGLAPSMASMVEGALAGDRPNGALAGD